MTGDTAAFIGMGYTAFTAGLVGALVWVWRDLRDLNRRRAGRRLEQHADAIAAYQPDTTPTLVRVVNGRPIMPPKLPRLPRVPAADTANFWPMQPQRWMDWTPPQVWEQPLLPIRGIVAFQEVTA